MQSVLLTPIFSWPILKSLIRRSSFSPLFNVSKALLTWLNSTCPSTVSWTPLEFLVNRGSPRLSSSLLMALLIAGWLIKSSFAAFEILPVLATA